MLRRLKASGLLSFGPKGVDLPMMPLNVLIGPNGSGKSNLLEAIALLRSATSDLAEPIARAAACWICWRASSICKARTSATTKGAGRRRRA